MKNSKTWPVVVDLTPNGKTLICINRTDTSKEILLAEEFIRILGQPEEFGIIRETNNIFLLFPHQNLTADLYKIARQMTTETLLSYLDKEKEKASVQDSCGNVVQAG